MPNGHGSLLLSVFVLRDLDSGEAGNSVSKTVDSSRSIW